MNEIYKRRRFEKKQKTSRDIHQISKFEELTGRDENNIPIKQETTQEKESGYM